MIKIQLGIPITIINGGMRAVRTVILYPNKTIVPTDHSTPTATTNIENITDEKVLKNTQRINAVIKTANARNNFISCDTFSITAVRIYGMPEKCNCT